MDTRILCLGALYRGASSGYEIRKQFEEGPFSHFQDAGFGSIYPALRKLTEDGLVTCTEHAQNNRPDKKIYALTSEGVAALKTAIEADPPEDKVRSDFMFVLFFADILDPDQAAMLIDRRIDFHRAVLDGMRQCDTRLQPVGRRFVKGMGEAIHQACLDYLEAHRADFIGELSDQTGRRDPASDDLMPFDLEASTADRAAE